MSGARIRMAAFDVDGTLRDRSYLPDSARSALRRLKENGIILALCTGRSEHEMQALREELGIDWAVTCNGSHIGYRGETVFANPFPRETMLRWLAEARGRGHTLLLYGAKRMYINEADSPYFRQAEKEIGFQQPDLIRDDEEVPDIYQCIIFCREEEEPAYTGDEPGLYYKHRWRTWAVDLNPNGRNKASGLRQLTAHLGVKPEELAAFGDGLNDWEMIESAGLGIAMGNADESLKMRAKLVTKPLAEDGIAYAVDRYILSEPS